MTKKEILKNFSFSVGTENGICESCSYIDMCDKILPGFNKPNKCGGPFYKI